jgi:acyl transferase domain-containing protein
MEPIVEHFLAFAGEVALAPPAVPFVSNVTGTWITDDQATSAAYWADHLRQRVRFGAGLLALAELGPLTLLELGPGDTLASLARQVLPGGPHVVASSLPRPDAVGADDRVAAETLARLWVTGTEPDWAAYWRHDPRGRVPLPTYPFERRRYWTDPPATAVTAGAGAEPPPLIAVTADVPDGTGTASAAAQQSRPESAAHPRSLLTAAFVSPRDTQEQRIASVWRELLGISEIGVHDNFFELGGHSLLATRVTARLIELLGVEVSPGAILEAPTVAELSAHLNSLSEDHAAEGADDPEVAAILAELERADDQTVDSVLKEHRP